MTKIKETDLELVDATDKTLLEIDALVQYVIKDLDDKQELLQQGIIYNPDAIYERCLTTLTMISDKVDTLREISNKRHELSKQV